MKECDTLLTASCIVPDASGKTIENGAIAVKDGKICAMGSSKDVQESWRGLVSHDLGNAVIIPGLVNAHTHGAMTFLRGYADDLPLMQWLSQKVFPVEARLDREITYLGSLLGYSEMLATGTTACIDMYIYEDAVFEAALASGIRCLGGEAIFNFPSAACRNADEALARTEELAFKYACHDRIAVAVNPHSVYTTDSVILKKCRDLAQKLDLPLHIHLAETREETARCLQTHKLRPVAWCAENGLFEGRLIAAHLVDVTEEEADLMARHKVIGVHNPTSNMKLASGAAPVKMMLEKGMIMALGTDGPASNNSLNIFKEMNLAALLQKLVTGKPEAGDARGVFAMATAGGASAIGGSGRLAQGMTADLAALDLDPPHMQPLYNPISQLVYAASGHECKLTMVGGRILWHNGQYAFDFEGLRREIKKLRNFVLKNHS